MEFHDAHGGDNNNEDEHKIFTDEELVQINTPDGGDDDDDDELYKTVLEPEKSHENDNDDNDTTCSFDDQDEYEATNKDMGKDAKMIKGASSSNNTPLASAALLKTPKPTTEFIGKTFAYVYLQIDIEDTIIFSYIF